MGATPHARQEAEQGVLELRLSHDRHALPGCAGRGACHPERLNARIAQLHARFGLAPLRGSAERPADAEGLIDEGAA